MLLNNHQYNCNITKSFLSVCISQCFGYPHLLKLPSLFLKLTQKSLKLITCILVCHSISFLQYFIILDKNNSDKLSHPKRNCQSGKSFFSQKYSRRAHRGPSVHFPPYKQVSVRNGVQEWLRTHNDFIVCDYLFWKENKEGSFKCIINVQNIYLWIPLSFSKGVSKVLSMTIEQTQWNNVGNVSKNGIIFNDKIGILMGFLNQPESYRKKSCFLTM